VGTRLGDSSWRRPSRSGIAHPNKANTKSLYVHYVVLTSSAVILRTREVFWLDIIYFFLILLFGLNNQQQEKSNIRKARTRFTYERRSDCFEKLAISGFK